MESFEEPTASYTDIFPPGQPFRSLYAMHVLTEYKDLARQPRGDGNVSGSKPPLSSSYTEARRRAVCFIVQAVLDPKVSSHTTLGLELRITSSFMQSLLKWLQGKPRTLRGTFDETANHSRPRFGRDRV